MGHPPHRAGGSSMSNSVISQEEHEVKIAEEDKGINKETRG